VANIFGAISTKFYPPGFVDDATKHLVCFGFAVPISTHLQNANAKFSPGSVATLFRWSGKRLIANLFKTMCTKFYQNRNAWIDSYSLEVGTVGIKMLFKILFILLITL